MWSRRRRRRALESWRAHRAGDGVSDLAELPPNLRVRPRRQAPTPRVPQSWRVLRRRFAGWPLTAALALLVAAVVAGTFLWRAPAFRVHGARVTGNQRVSAEIIYAASYLDGAWAFTVSRADAQRRVELLDDVRTARVRVAWPARAAIEVEETAAVLLWSTPAVNLAVDETGRAIVPPADSAGLVSVRDETGLLAAPGDRLPEATFHAALADTAAFGGLTYRRAEGFVARTADGWEVRLGNDAGVVDQQVRLLSALAAQLAPVRGSVAVVDLRFPSRPYYRLREGANGS
jgi:cell division protein FtsQ